MFGFVTEVTLLIVPQYHIRLNGRNLAIKGFDICDEQSFSSRIRFSTTDKQTGKQMRIYSIKNYSLWLVLTGVIILSACSNPQADIIGSWQQINSDNTITFRKDGRLVINVSGLTTSY
ncbi:MAG: hypothetical protein BMS9Abin26_1089 [Gammaproteobacteria bacterium]|nr:MAG: hypothetical protein BMS9Abin26_1089 [Gammaproteobacteria bacterium]